MIRALIFDFDGIIMDTEVPGFQSWQEIYQRHGLILPLEQWIQCVGRSEAVLDPYGYLERCAGRTLNRDEIIAQRRRRQAELNDQQPAMPGVVDLLQEAKKLDLLLAVASSSPHSWVDRYLEQLGLLPDFDLIKCRDDVAKIKPEPDLFLAALAGLSLEPGEAIVFEDSPNGLLAAKRAGIFTVAVPNSITYGENFDLADLRIDSLADLDLPALLTQLNGAPGERATGA